MSRLPMPDETILDRIQEGIAIPAHPLVLDANRKMDERHQRALTRYYLSAGVGGLAVGVHTTQFQIRDEKIGLFRPVLEMAAEEIDKFVSRTGKPIVKIAGLVGRTQEALQQARVAVDLGYDAGLLSLAAFKQDSNDTMLEHCRAVAEAMPIFGFYLQPSVGGRILDVDFWRQFAQIENVVAIKMAPFNRYQTLDVVRGVAESGRAGDIALYTGNDDNILLDLLTPYQIPVNGEVVELTIVGGLLGHWAVWTRRAVEIFEQVRQIAKKGEEIPRHILSLAMKITDCNAAFFDAANNFAGCIVGIHEVLRRQGLMPGIWTLNPNETLSPGQRQEIDRVYKAYPELNDDDFVAANLDKWLA